MKNASSICMGWIWYLQVEFWFYASFPINAILYNRNKALGKVWNGNLLSQFFADSCFEA